MRHIRTEIEIDASAERVWTILADLPAYAEWNPLIREAGGNVVEGGRIDLFICAPGLASRRVRVKLLRVDPGRELRWLGRLFAPNLLDGDHSFELDPVRPGRVRVVQKETFRGLFVPFVARWLVRNMTHGFEAMNQALKQRAESPSPPSPATDRQPEPDRRNS